LSRGLSYVQRGRGKQRSEGAPPSFADVRGDVGGSPTLLYWGRLAGRAQKRGRPFGPSSWC
jgi:hypothetical protein